MNGYQEFNQLEQSIANAGSQLHTVAFKLHEVERSLNDASNDEMDDLCVMELLESMSEVRNEYTNLRKDIREVQQLQRDVTTSLRYQMRCMQNTFEGLKKRLELRAAAAAAATQN